VALGHHGIDTIKSVIDRSKAGADRTVSPLELSLSLTRIMEFAASQSDDATVRAIAEKLKAAGGNDHLRVTAKAIPRGVRYRVEVEEGVLKAIGDVTSASGALGSQ